MTTLRELLDEYAERSDYETKAESFLHLNRWTGDSPLLLLADAAGTTTGQGYFNHVKPSIEQFRDQFLETGRITSFQ